MKDFFLILIGAICSTLGGCAAGCLAIWYQAKKTRQIRMEEKAAEVQFEARRKALVLIRQLRTFLPKREHGNARNFFSDNGSWFSENWMFLPDKYVENWRSIGWKLHDLARAEQNVKETTDQTKEGEYIEEAVALGKEMPQLALEAEDVLRKEMGLKEAG
ncbi:MAG: hypothetical protein WC476_09615 [Phycisphaerae bacterium]|jgi:hypothetical protein